MAGVRPYSKGRVKENCVCATSPHSRSRPQRRARQRPERWDGASPLIAKIMDLFFDMDTMIGGDFAQRLVNLKAIAEI